MCASVCMCVCMTLSVIEKGLFGVHVCMCRVNMVYIISGGI